jgi:hypothetical protein
MIRDISYIIYESYNCWNILMVSSLGSTISEEGLGEGIGEGNGEGNWDSFGVGEYDGKDYFFGVGGSDFYFSKGYSSRLGNYRQRLQALPIFNLI